MAWVAVRAAAGCEQHLVTVGQVAAVGQVKRHDAVVGLEKTSVHCTNDEKTRLGAG